MSWSQSVVFVLLISSLLGCGENEIRKETIKRNRQAKAREILEEQTRKSLAGEGLTIPEEWVGSWTGRFAGVLRESFSRRDDVDGEIRVVLKKNAHGMISLNYDNLLRKDQEFTFICDVAEEDQKQVTFRQFRTESYLGFPIQGSIRQLSDGETPRDIKAVQQKRTAQDDLIEKNDDLWKQTTVSGQLKQMQQHHK